MNKVCGLLVFIGGLNWGLVGVGMLLGKGMAWNVVTMLLGKWPMVEAIIYILVGIAAICKLSHCKCAKCCAACMPVAGGAAPMGGQQM